MDIFILSEGKEIGPLSEETAQTLINQGTVAAADLAWRTGMEDWAPLGEVLSPGNKSDLSDQSDKSDPSGPSDPSAQPDQPDPSERKEDRANHFFDICQTEGAQYFTRITKAHCLVLVGFLDAKFPTWDSRMEDAATNYFFPAIAEKFPQLIERQWKDRFHYAVQPGAESAAPAARAKKRPVTPLEAIVRGIALGAAILAALYFGQKMAPRWMEHHSGAKAGSGYAAPPP